MKTNWLIVLTGPTGIGKTDLSIEMARQFNSVIISGDSRQIYKELYIGTAAPTPLQTAMVPHYLIATHSVTDYYNAWQFEQDVLQLTRDLFPQINPIILTGGSMMYIDALCNGIDELPTIDTELRENLARQYREEGIDPIRRLLKQLDPVFYNQMDLQNHKRVIHAVEICMMTGKPYSDLRTKPKHDRPFNILKIGLEMDREELYDRINRRVDMMMQQGLEDEAKQLYHLRHLNSLNTVGYRELFDYFDGNCTLPEAIELIKRNSRRYAKKQLSWFRRDKEMHWFHPAESEKIIKFVIDTIHQKGKPA
ncbi:tRNA dimethylallyltransferase [Breznakibacter xylanolyticus]|uniref:tRNA dimethylallyltransferase n=1 Tax=Breznakibacter xylanolyticus TaxID=990 RepID=A0A2W7NNA3_9BACT|nr:tRNA (adenosine(37)-N6)-dimethylallyltransferase MiaA [Breznakibacter xylanolyticus]PZX12742.1 tRNA dimethylallyltransferase [Breznakibacter xylanolyticus]